MEVQGFKHLSHNTIAAGKGNFFFHLALNILNAVKGQIILGGSRRCRSSLHYNDDQTSAALEDFRGLLATMLLREVEMYAML